MSLPASVTTDAHSFYLCALHSLRHAKIDFLVGGAYALERYTGISRDTKDLDVFVRPEDCERVLAAFAESGFDTELTFPTGWARHGRAARWWTSSSARATAALASATSGSNTGSPTRGWAFP